jgi:radical SAM superfamily enzyme YgiQ (UPF0313 family)
MNYHGILLFGQNYEFAGRGIAGPRLRTEAKKYGFDVMVIDYTLSLDLEKVFNIIDRTITDSTKFIGFSASWIDQNNLSQYFWYQQSFFDEIRKRWPNVLIITGGHDEWKKDFLLKNSDYHFHGYSDHSFVEFLKMIHKQPHQLQYYRNPLTKGYIINSNANHPVINPDDLETIFLKEDGFESYQPLPIEVARGCIFRCGFCRHPFQGKKDFDSYQRTPESLARELKRNYDLFGTTRYTILDDTFNDSIEKISRLQQAVKNAGLPKFEFVSYIKPELLVTKPEMIDMLVDLGLRGAFIGFESFNNEARKLIGKGTKIEKVLEACKRLASLNNQQVKIHGSFITGLKNDTVKDLFKTLSFLKSKENTFISSWWFEPVGVREYNYDALDTPSTFDKEASELGYTFKNGNWFRDDGWSLIKAAKINSFINNESMNFVKPAGWKIAGCWQLGMLDNEIENYIRE